MSDGNQITQMYSKKRTFMRTPKTFLKGVVLKENVYCKVQNYLKIIMNVKNLILRKLRTLV